VHELIRDTCPDLISFSETKKADFSGFQIQSIDCYNVYTWNWLPADGTAGGILVGVKEDSFEVISWEIFKYCVSVIIRDRKNGGVWRFVSVYGSSYDEFKLEFINELHNVMACWDGPTLIGGDFNLIRDSGEKSSGNINQHWANLFIDWSNRYDLIEIKNAGRLYTWANNQENLIIAAIDKVFVTTCWEQLFPAVSVRALPRVGSDHTPLVVDSGAFIAPKMK
jgi:exonuclease III